MNKKVIVFAQSDVPSSFGFYQCPDLNFFRENIEDLTDQDYISIPHGEIGKELVKEMVNFFYPNGSTSFPNREPRKLPNINVHSGTKKELEEMRDYIFNWVWLGENSYTTFFKKNDIDFEYNIQKTFKEL